MSRKTNSELTTQAQVIRDETTAGANSASRIYTMLKDIVDSVHPGRKVICISVTQSGSSDPTVTTHFSNLSGTVVWTRSTTGTYVGTLAGAFLSGKVPKLEGFIKNGSSIGSSILNTYTIQRLTDDTIALGTFQNGTLTDGLLSSQYFEIPVFD